MHLLNVLDLLEGVQVIERKIFLAIMYSGLRMPQFRAMHFLEKSGRTTVSALSRKLNVTRATASVLVNELLKAGLIATVENKSDRRSFYLELTESGNKRLNSAREEISVVQTNISRDLSKETIRVMNDFSETIKWKR